MSAWLTGSGRWGNERGANCYLTAVPQWEAICNHLDASVVVLCGVGVSVPDKDVGADCRASLAADAGCCPFFPFPTHVFSELPIWGRPPYGPPTVQVAVGSDMLEAGDAEVGEHGSDMVQK